MKISAIIPAYNNAQHIKAAIASIEAQTIHVDEIIVVDDGSSDETEQMLSSLHYNIVYHKQVNQGPSAARNKGIELATGDWIAFLDADDQWQPNKIALQLEALERSPSLHLIAGDMMEINPDGTVITVSVLAKHDLLNNFIKLAGKPTPNALNALIKKNFIPTGTVLVKRATLLEAGMFNPSIRFGEDLELWAKIAAKHPITCLPEVLMLRLQHGHNATQATLAMLIDLTKVMKSICNYASSELVAQGCNPEKLIADSYWTLGYWYFVNDSISEAKAAFRLSLHEKITPRAWAYFLSCMLPTALISRIRLIKQQFAKH